MSEAFGINSDLSFYRRDLDFSRHRCKHNRPKRSLEIHIYMYNKNVYVLPIHLCICGLHERYSASHKLRHHRFLNREAG